MTAHPAGDLDDRSLRVRLRGLLARHLAEVLGDSGIPMMPLKGGLFALWIYDDPSDRQGQDLDILVPEGTFDRAVACLAAAGFGLVAGPREHYQVGMASPAAPIVIDLHRSFFPPGYYRLRTGDVFARGREDSDLYGVPVIVPDPYDAYAHLVGHTAAFPFTELGETTRRDFDLLARRFNLSDGRCAAHLRDCGLARAALYTFGRPGAADPFARAVVRRLSDDHVGRGLARLSWTLARRFPRGSLPAKCSVYLTNASLPASANLLVHKLARRIRDRGGRRRPGVAG